MLAKFPPGAIVYQKKNKSMCKWREFAFAFHQIQQAINPTISLAEVLRKWHEISSALGENSRFRKPQLENLNYKLA